MQGALVMVLALANAPVPLVVRTVCRPPDDSHEAHLLADFSVPIAYSLLEAPRETSPGAVRLTLEGTYIPNIDEETRTATICRAGKGPENANLLSAFPRPRAALGLPGGMLLEASWIPPVRLNGVKSNLVGLSLERGFPIGENGLLLALRAHGTFGVVRAPITCPDEALADPDSECYQGTRSDDHYHPNIFGAEAALGWSLGGGQVRPFLGGGFNVLHPRFQVDFTNRVGQVDNTRIEVNLGRAVLFGGATWAPAAGWGLTGEIYSAPSDKVTGRLALSYGIRS
jgi:hypothetical protein